MKKLLSIILALCLCLTLTPNVFATDVAIPEGRTVEFNIGDGDYHAPVNDVIGTYDYNENTVTYVLQDEPKWEQENDENYVRIFSGIQVPKDAEYATLSDGAKFGKYKEDFVSIDMWVDESRPEKKYTYDLTWHRTDGSELGTERFTVKIIAAYNPTPVPVERIDVTTEKAEISTGEVFFPLPELEEGTSVTTSISTEENSSSVQVFANNTPVETVWTSEKIDLQQDVPAVEETTLYKIKWYSGTTLIKTETLTVHFGTVEEAEWSAMSNDMLRINEEGFYESVVDGVTVSKPESGTISKDDTTTISVKMTKEQWNKALYNSTDAEFIVLPFYIQLPDNAIAATCGGTSEGPEGALELLKKQEYYYFRNGEPKRLSRFVSIASVAAKGDDIIITPNTDCPNITLKWKDNEGKEYFYFVRVNIEQASMSGIKIPSLAPTAERVYANVDKNQEVQSSDYQDGILTYYINSGNTEPFYQNVKTFVVAPDGAEKAIVNETTDLDEYDEKKGVFLTETFGTREYQSFSWKIQWLDAEGEIVKSEKIQLNSIPVGGERWMDTNWNPAENVNSPNDAFLESHYKYNNEDGCLTFDVNDEKLDTLNLQRISGQGWTNTANGYFWVDVPEGASKYSVFDCTTNLTSKDLAKFTSSAFEDQERIPIEDDAKKIPIHLGGPLLQVTKLDNDNGIDGELSVYSVIKATVGYYEMTLVQWYNEKGELIKTDDGKQGIFVYRDMKPFTNIVKNEMFDGFPVNPVDQPTLLTGIDEAFFNNLRNYCNDKELVNELEKLTNYHEFSKGDKVYLKVEEPLQEQTDNGKTRYKYTDISIVNEFGDRYSLNGNFVAIILPYPEGVSYENVDMDKITIQHYLDADLIDKEEISMQSKRLVATENGILFVTNSFSPFVLGTVVAETEPPVDPTPTPPSGGGIVPPADNVTNDAADKTTTADLNATVGTDGKATATVDSTTADKIVDKAVANSSTEVTLDVTTDSGKSDSAEVKLPAETIKNLVDKTEADIIVKTDNAEMKLDQEAAKAITETASTGTVTLVVEKTKDDANAMHFELKVVTDNGMVLDFNGGKVHVTVKLNEALKAVKNLVCVYIDDNGKYSRVDGTKNADGTFTFVTGHFSEYAVMEAEEADKIIAQQNDKLIKGVENTTIKASSEAAKGFIRVKWTKSKGYKVDYYEVYKAKSKAALKANKTPYFKTKSGTWKSYKNTKGLKKGTRYFYRVRGARVIDGKTYYTKWSTIANRYAK